MQELDEEKRALRRALGARAKALDAAYRAAADRAIRGAVLNWEPWARAQTLFVYVSLPTEPDTRALIEAALAAGKRVFVPLCGPGGVMRAVRIRDLAELRPGTLGIPEPSGDGETAAPGSIDLALVPCVSAAESGARLGHGAGYYDRFLALHRCPTLCLCYEALLCAELPMGERDIRMEHLVTEKGLRPCRDA